MANPFLNNAEYSVAEKVHGPLKRFGIYLGKVEYIDDPMQLGRVCVRIPAIHGPETLTTTENLPWAAPCNTFGGGSGYGSFMIPPVGSMVWIAFDGGDVNFPVVLGTLPIAPVGGRKMLRDSNLKHPLGTQSMTQTSDKPWTTPPTNESPTEYLQMVRAHPETYVPFKSPKGASLVVEDRDEAERTRLTDRSGQGLIMTSPITRGNNVNNKAQRKLQNSDEGNSLPAESLVERLASLTLVDAGSQSIEFVTKKANQPSDHPDVVNDYHGRIRIISRQPSTSSEADGTESTRSGHKETEGENSVVLDMSGSDHRFTIELQKDGEVNTLIHLDSKDGSITIDTPNNIVLSSNNIKLNGNVSVSGNLLVGGVQINNKDLLVSGDLLYNPADVAEVDGNPNPTV